MLTDMLMKYLREMTERGDYQAKTLLEMMESENAT